MKWTILLTLFLALWPSMVSHPLLPEIHIDQTAFVSTWPHNHLTSRIISAKKPIQVEAGATLSNVLILAKGHGPLVEVHENSLAQTGIQMTVVTNFTREWIINSR